MTTPPTLNQGQKAAADAFFDFLLTDDKEFIISGPAGVGKTFLMSYIIDHTMTHYHKVCELMGIKPKYTEVQMTATTNKAADVLGQSVKRPTSTIHSFMNLRVQNDFKTGKQLLSRTRNWEVYTNKIIFIDECSMIDSDLYNMLMEGTFDCKIVYVGDHNQLAPIYEAISPIYRQNAPFYELTEQMRNRNNQALMDVCQQLRTTVETGEFLPIHVDGHSVIHLNDDEMQAMLGQQFVVPVDDSTSRILAYTNNQVNEYNLYLREQKGLPDNLTVGETLVNNTAVRIANKHQLSVEQEVTIVDAGKGEEEYRLDEDSYITIQRVTLDTSFGERIYNVPVPTDREHFNSLMKYYASKKNWERHYFMKENFPDLRPRDAATVHKAQGSTYDSVFIDLSNISKVTQPDVAARMLYVAFTRARSKVYLYGQLAKRFGGLVF